METLAFIYAAVTHEHTNSEPQLRKSKNTDIKASCSSAITLVTSCVVAGTIAYANPVQASVHYGSAGSDVKKLQTALSGIPVDGIFGSKTLARLKSYQNKHGLAVDGIAGSATLSSLGLPTSPQNRNTQPERYGKLKLINDTPYMAIITLHEPGKEEASKYANIPPCSERTLLNTYSSSWKVSFNGQKKHSIAKFLDGKNFKVRTYKLNTIKDAQSCKYDWQQTEEIQWWKYGQVTLAKAPQYADDAARFITRSTDDIARAKKVPTPTFMGNLANVDMHGQMAVDKFVAAKLVTDKTKLTRYHENIISNLRSRYLNKELTIEDFQKVKDELQRLSKECEQILGIGFKVLTKELFLDMMSDFARYSRNNNQHIYSLSDKSTFNNSAALPKAKEASATLELQCSPSQGGVLL
ncbi:MULTISPECIES: peptidoglycan-binding protein [Nostoc]|uniref:Peptidoglycan-binding protein n=1 Tax=Nostoc paludosum FACHB-159 TaxID=2692908 RepID=A0ABR8KK62_9NOSO|nr:MULTISPECIES: peptidoglycan-binding domain-containing protein [Nostoc]MBD2683120.1 peptidoglycan-binding protein [Nostoc sp. FACHB-857]MBD2739480.1 peptidoglycan-binding protein [Nostoc paludosum FACHB-159]